MSDISLLQLPLDVLINILGKLTYSDLRNVMLVCKFLRDIIINESSIWRLVSRNKLIVHNASYNGQTINTSGFHTSRISLNWRKGVYEAKIAVAHQINYMPWLRMYNTYLLLSVGSELHCFPTDKRGFPLRRKMLWNLQVPTVKRYDVRTNDISRFVIKDNLLLCGNRDGCVAVYKMENVNEEPCLLHHIKDCHKNGKVEVTAVELLNINHKPYIVTASNYCSVLRFWCLTTESSSNLNNGVMCESIVCSNEIDLGDKMNIRCLSMHSNEEKLAVGLNGNSKPLLLEVTTGKLLHKDDTTKHVRQLVRDIEWHNENIVMYVTHSGVLQLLDIRSGDVVFNAMEPFQASLYCVRSDRQNAIVVGSAEYSRCVLFDSRNSSRFVQMYCTQKRSSPIYSLDFDSSKLIAAADRSVAVLDFSVSINTTEIRDYSQPFQYVPR